MKNHLYEPFVSISGKHHKDEVQLKHNVFDFHFIVYTELNKEVYLKSDSSSDDAKKNIETIKFHYSAEGDPDLHPVIKFPRVKNYTCKEIDGFLRHTWTITVSSHRVNNQERGINTDKYIGVETHQGTVHRPKG